MKSIEKMYDKGFKNGVFFGVIITIIAIATLGFMVYGFAIFNYLKV